MTTGLLLVGHGSRDPLTRIEHDALQAQLCSSFVDWRVASGFIELSDPPLIDALTRLALSCDRVVVAPLLLFAGGHMQRDVPRAVVDAQRAAPNTLFVISEPFGLSAQVIDLVADQIRRRERGADATVCLVVGRGASEVSAQQAFQQAIAHLASRRPQHRYTVAYCGVEQPTVRGALETLAQSGCAHVIVVPYLLFTGTLHKDIERAVVDVGRQHPSLEIELAGHLGPAVVDAVAAQIRLAIERRDLPKS